MKQDFMARLAALGAVLDNDHFVYASGYHGPAHINKRAVVVHTAEVSSFCEEMARLAHEVDPDIDAVVAPAVGAIALGIVTADKLAMLTSRPVSFFIAEKDGDGFVVKTEPHLLSGTRVMVVEDILTTGGSAKKAIELARSLGANVVGVAALVNRGGVTPGVLGVEHLVTLVNVDMSTYPANECPLCEEGKPVNTHIGHGAAFMAKRGGS